MESPRSFLLQPIKRKQISFDVSKGNCFEDVLNVAFVKSSISRYKRKDKFFARYITAEKRTQALYFLLRQEQNLFCNEEITVQKKMQVSKVSYIWNFFLFYIPPKVL